MEDDAHRGRVANTRGRRLVGLALVMVVGGCIGIPFALGVSWATDGAVSFWASMVTVVIASAVVPAWTSWSSRKIDR